MAYISSKLSVVSYANGFTLWHYVSSKDTFAAINAPGYFQGAEGLLREGDFVMINGADYSGQSVVLPVKATIKLDPMVRQAS